MIYTIGAILAAIASLAAWVYKLIQQNRGLKEEAARRDIAIGMQEWHDKIQMLSGNVTEDIKDYEKSKDALNDQLNSITTK